MVQSELGGSTRRGNALNKGEACTNTHFTFDSHQIEWSGFERKDEIDKRTGVGWWNEVNDLEGDVGLEADGEGRRWGGQPYAAQARRGQDGVGGGGG